LQSTPPDHLVLIPDQDLDLGTMRAERKSNLYKDVSVFLYIVFNLTKLLLLNGVVNHCKNHLCYIYQLHLL
jgi:hypothetical protein